MSERAKLIEKIIDSVGRDDSFNRANLEFLNAIELDKREAISELKGILKRLSEVVELLGQEKIATMEVERNSHTHLIERITTKIKPVKKSEEPETVLTPRS